MRTQENQPANHKGRPTAIHVALALTPQGWRPGVRLVLEGPSIAAVEVGEKPARHDERCAIAIPALSNLHSHAFQRAIAGLTEFRGKRSESFWSWRDIMYRFALKMEPEDVEAVAAQAYVEMLEAGYAAVAEFHYLHHTPRGAPYDDPAELSHRVIAAAHETGIGLTLLPVFYAHGGFGGLAPENGQQRFVSDLDMFSRIVESCRRAVRGRAGDIVGVAPHSLRAVTPPELDAVAAIGREGPIHIHAAEQAREVEDCLAALGARPVAWLLDNARIDSRWCLVHATHIDAAETRGLVDSGAVAGLCPITEANLGDGVFNGAEYFSLGGRFGIGTDSNVAIGAAEELRQLEYAQRLQLMSRTVLARPVQSNGRALLEAAFAGGAQALGRASGGFRAGALADIVTLNEDHPTFAGKIGDPALDAFVFSVGKDAIDCVWSAGQKVVAGGRHPARDRVAKRFRHRMQVLMH